MTILGIDPRNNLLRWPKGSPYQLRIHFADGLGGLLDISGRSLRFATFRSGGDVVFEAALETDGTTAWVVFAGDVSLLPGLDGSAWQVAQLFEGGATPLFRGSVNTVDAAANQGAGDGPPPSDLLTWAPATQTLLISSIGAQGLSAAQQLVQAGAISDATSEALRAYLDGVAAGAGAEAGADAGVQAGADAGAAAGADAGATAGQAAGADAGATAGQAAGATAGQAAGASSGQTAGAAAGEAAGAAAGETAGAGAGAAAVAPSIGAANVATAAATAKIAETEAARQASITQTELAATATGAANTAAGAANAAAVDAVTKTALSVTATTGANAAATSANNAAAQIVPEGGPSLLIKPGTGTFPSIVDTYFTGRKSLYSNFDGIRRQLRGFTEVTDFVRASAATYFDTLGALQTATSGAARLGYRFNTGASSWVLAGMLVEGQATNLALRSNDLTATGIWNRLGAGIGTGLQIVEDALLSSHYLTQNIPSVTAGTSYCMSVIVSDIPGSAKRYFSLLVAGSVSTPTGALFDLATGVVVRLDGVATKGAGITSLGAGKYLVWVSYTADQTGSAGVQCRLMNLTTSIAAQYQGDGVSGVNLSEFQYEAGVAFPTSRIRTIAAQVTRAADVLSKALGVEFNQASQSALFRTRWDRPPADGAAKVLYQWDDGTPNNRVSVTVSATGVIQVQVVVGGVAGATVTGPTAVTGTDYKVAVGFAGSLRLVVNGTAYTDAAISTLPTGLVTRRIGSSTTGAAQPGAFIMPYLPHPTNPLLDATEFPRLLTVAEMQGYTA